MAFTAYDNAGKYAVYNQEGCSDCGDTSSSSETNSGCKECSCCPPGLVEQRDSSGNIIGCFTPNDSFGYMINTYKCPEGYVKWIDAEGNFRGCVTVDEYLLLNP